MEQCPIRILGIDPGLRRTGWGVITCEGNRLIYVACGSVETDNKAAGRPLRTDCMDPGAGPAVHM